MKVAIIALMAAAATIWSYVQFPIPEGLGFLSLLNGAAVAAGYLSGFEIKDHVLSPVLRVFIYVCSLTACVAGALCYAYLVYLGDAGFKMAAEMIISAVTMCYFLSVLVGALASRELLPTTD
ncbi:hypothetical protein [Mesorhizobium captivum]|uniref:hypothetical protein n=1 Tax=Mesorhizobium captivum TaxID=3072319 RepID=UPI002A23E483|nr:hypothetical protein [Mesorhizobium sp. VK23E]MDX8515851.1 hypothetical protein [Mesorhizobium sp. VK23E]